MLPDESTPQRPPRAVGSRSTSRLASPLAICSPSRTLEHPSPPLPSPEDTWYFVQAQSARVPSIPSMSGPSTPAAGESPEPTRTDRADVESAGAGTCDTVGIGAVPPLPPHSTGLSSPTLSDSWQAAAHGEGSMTALPRRVLALSRTERDARAEVAARRPLPRPRQLEVSARQAIGPVVVGPPGRRSPPPVSNPSAFRDAASEEAAAAEARAGGRRWLPPDRPTIASVARGRDAFVAPGSTATAAARRARAFADSSGLRQAAPRLAPSRERHADRALARLQGTDAISWERTRARAVEAPPSRETASDAPSVSSLGALIVQYERRLDSPDHRRGPIASVGVGECKPALGISSALGPAASAMLRAAAHSECCRYP